MILQATNTKQNHSRDVRFIQSALTAALCGSVMLYPLTCHAVDSIPPNPSTNAARFLIDPPSKKLKEQREASLQIVRKQMEMQDDRLEQCQESGSEWEQCFFFGTTSLQDSLPTQIYSEPSTVSKSKIPTW